MSATPSANIHEAQARTTKAVKLIAAVSVFSARHKLPAMLVAQRACIRDREMFAALAGVHMPSTETWAQVVQALTEAALICDACHGSTEPVIVEGTDGQPFRTTAREACERCEGSGVAEEARQ